MVAKRYNDILYSMPQKFYSYVFMRFLGTKNISMRHDIVLGNNSNVEYMVKVGDNVTIEDIEAIRATL